jgi:phosphatidylinositol alpha-mannosyltransferase
LFKNDPNKDIDIIFLGRLVKRKGCEHLINAIKLIDQNKKLKVAIVGDGLLKDKLMHKVKSYKLNESITFYGHVNEQHKKLLLSRAKLAIFPSVGGESFGIVLLEAMSSGALVIAGDNPGYKSVMGNNSNAIVNPKKSYLFAKTINSFLTNSTLYKKELSYQQNIIKHFDINQVGNDILNVYKKAINKHKNE